MTNTHLHHNNAPMRSLGDEVRISDRGLAFLTAIIDAQAWDTGIVESFLEKPWHWDDEFTQWLNNGAPTEPMTDEFEAWVAQMDAKPSQ